LLGASDSLASCNRFLFFPNALNVISGDDALKKQATKEKVLDGGEEKYSGPQGQTNDKMALFMLDGPGLDKRFNWPTKIPGATKADLVKEKDDKVEVRNCPISGCSCV